MYSHNGYWMNGGTSLGTEGNVAQCAEDCIEDDTCVAINYHYSGSQRGECFHYRGISILNQVNEKVHSSTHPQLTKAYIRCPGRIQIEIILHFCFQPFIFRNRV